MRAVIRAETVIPGLSGGIEHFTAGLVCGLVEVMEGPDEAIVTIASGSQDQWEAMAPPAKCVTYVPVTSAGSVVVAGLKRPHSERVHSLRSMALRMWPTRAALAAFRRYVDASVLTKLRPTVTYYPAHRHPIRGHPAVITVHDLRCIEPSFFEERAVRVLRHNVAQASAIVSSWPHPFRRLVDVFPESSNRAFMIPFPVMIGPGQGSTRSQGPPDKYLLYPAITSEAKNHIVLIEALAVMNRQRSIRLICTGAKVPPMYDRLVQRANELGISDLIEFRGFVSRSELDGLYRSSAAVVVPSLWEAASGPVFEAFAYGRPVACSDIPPIRSQVEFVGATVSYFDPSDVASLVEAIGRVLDHPDFFIRGSLAGAATMSRFTWSRTAAEYLSVWRWVASGGRAERPGESLRLGMSDDDG